MLILEKILRAYTQSTDFFILEYIFVYYKNILRVVSSIKNTLSIYYFEYHNPGSRTTQFEGKQKFKKNLESVRSEKKTRTTTS